MEAINRFNGDAIDSQRMVDAFKNLAHQLDVEREAAASSSASDDRTVEVAKESYSRESRQDRRARERAEAKAAIRESRKRVA